MYWHVLLSNFFVMITSTAYQPVWCAMVLLTARISRTNISVVCLRAMRSCDSYVNAEEHACDV